ncbi:hypothetical protein KSF_020890 [Reticulibacter mediterranei]|uniref:Uncharacterized protein n=1 Tax=Reticulibacter mediterranei TaxID=2778369 RepID=A0A8J3IKU6_9CHLR|nr:hypothetical protein [Reticulibacter mediterranei]GHO92041.1 hypothetical protein KSF_020890 [Reticulibacter mediterranei]
MLVKQTQETSSYVSEAAPSDRLLVCVRILWSLLIPSLVALSCFFFPRYLELMSTICHGSAATCSAFQPNMHTLQALHAIGLTLDRYVWISAVLMVASALVWWLVAAIIAWKNFNHWFALSVSLLAALQATMDTRPPDFLSPLPMLWQWVLMGFIGLVETMYPLLGVFFPDGKLAPRWTRWILIVWFSIGLPCNLLADMPSVSPEWQEWCGLVFSYCWYGCMAAVLVAQVYRYRHVYGPVERQQTKWVLFCGVLVVLQQTIQYSLQWIFPVLNEPGSLFNMFYYVAIRTFLSLLSLSILMAMLRYRLWDVDVFINRALVYGTLTIILVLVYVGLVLALGTLSRHLIGQSDAPAMIISTLIVVALLQPLRRRLQESIDRRFYRSKYNAAQVIAAFSATSHNRADPMELSTHLLKVVEDAMRPTHVSLWMRKSKQRKEQ